jgi:hypothetical protein
MEVVVSGTVFSILSMIDGATLDLPAFDLACAPHDEDREYHISEGANYFEAGQVINYTQLHEEFSALT